MCVREPLNAILVLCLSALIKTFGFPRPALEECVSEYVCGRHESEEESKKEVLQLKENAARPSVNRRAPTCLSSAAERPAVCL